MSECKQSKAHAVEDVAKVDRDWSSPRNQVPAMPSRCLSARPVGVSVSTIVFNHVIVEIIMNKVIVYVYESIFINLCHYLESTEWAACTTKTIVLVVHVRLCRI